MIVCPHCRSGLQSSSGPSGRFFRCDRCRGRACTIAFLRKHLDRDEANRVWNALYERFETASVACPTCLREMRQGEIDLPSGPVVLDGCKSCQLIWFDGKELDRFARTPGKEQPEKELAPEAKMALLELDLARLKRAREEERDLEKGPDELWKTVPAALGLPVEEQTAIRSGPPWATWTLAATICAVSFAAMAMPELMKTLAFVPSAALGPDGLASWLTSFFVHAGMIHLLGNVYYLLVFGDDVEELLGPARFLLLLLVAEIAAGLGHALLAPDLTMPVVGSSGGISGVLAYYIVRLPHARIGLFVWLHIFRHAWVSVPAWLAFIGWLGLQAVGAVWQSHGSSSISAGAHLGGAAVGLLLGFFGRKVSARRSSARISASAV